MVMHIDSVVPYKEGFSLTTEVLGDLLDISYLAEIAQVQESELLRALTETNAEVRNETLFFSKKKDAEAALEILWGLPKTA